MLPGEIRKALLDAQGTRRRKLIELDPQAGRGVELEGVALGALVARNSC